MEVVAVVVALGEEVVVVIGSQGEEVVGVVEVFQIEEMIDFLVAPTEGGAAATNGEGLINLRQNG